MIVPRTRLLIWATLVLVPFGTLAGIDTGARLFALIAIAVFAVTLAIDALAAPTGLAGIEVSLPELLRVSRDKAASMTVRFRNARQRAAAIRIAFDIPAGLGTSIEEMATSLPAGSEWAQVEWPLQPRQRGRFTIHTARVEAVSPLGFWDAWKTLPVTGEVRVYPNLMRDRKRLAGLFMNRGMLGLHAQRMVGKGRDFEKLREYLPGDSYDEIHWKATAKRGQPVTKIFQVEKTQEVYVVIDASRLSARAAEAEDAVPPAGAEEPGVANSLERFITAALVLGLAAEKQGDLFGLLTFSDKVESFIRARNGKSHYHACRDALYTLQAREVTPDFDELSTFIRLRMRRRALLVFLTSLDDPMLAESFVRSMDLVCRQHLVVVNMLQPRGAEPLFTRAAESEHDLYGALGGHIRWHSLRELEKVLQRRGVRFSVLSGNRLAADMVSQYLNVKQRQIL